MYFSIWMLYFLVMEPFQLHMPGTYLPHWAVDCQFVHRPGSKPPALGTVLACGEVAAWHPQARLFFFVHIVPRGKVLPCCFQPSADDPCMICDIPDETVKLLVVCLEFTIFLAVTIGVADWCCVIVSRCTCHVGSHK